MTSQEHGKTAKYVEELNEARLEGNWSAVGEPLRKIEKHAPGRQCLIVATTVEAEIGSRINSRPRTANEQEEDHSLARTATRLSEAIETDQSGSSPHADDVFLARVTRAHCQLLESQWFNALESLTPSRWPATNGPASSAMRLSLLKAKYIYGASLESIGSMEEAAETYRSAIPLIEDCQRQSRQYKEIQRWSNRILAQLCVRSAAGDEATVEGLGLSLLSFRKWALSLRGMVADSSMRRSERQTWQAYYRLLSQLLHSNVVYQSNRATPLGTRSFNVPRTELSAQRRPQYDEISRVQTAYTMLLLQDTHFPKASQSNREFEDFVDQTVANWRVITGIEWTDADIGKNGQVGCTLSLLDVLYKAASRTFHSTRILRHLFTVHASLAEFDVALKAFDAYTDIIGKGKARAEKTGKHDPDLDSDDNVLHTAAHAIKILCLYGQREHIEKAYEIGQKIQSWLLQERPRSSADPHLDFGTGSEKVSAENFSSAPALAAAYKGIGQSQACWARYTYDSELREELQDDAVRNLHKSFVLCQANGIDLEIANLLAFSQAEKRLIGPALTTIKTALGKFDTITLPSVSAHPAEIKFDEQRQRLPIVHLLILLLGVRGEHEAALKICESTIEDLVDWGTTCDDVDGLQTGSTHNSYALDGILPERLKQGLLSFEKETLLQIKITEMELIILLENVSYAGTKRLELLKMYSQLFGNPKGAERPDTEDQQPEPLTKSRTGTVKSLRNSILGRSKSARASIDGNTPDHLSLRKGNATNGTHKETRNATPVSLTVTNEKGEKVDSEPKHKGGRLSMAFRKGHSHHQHGDTTDSSHINEKHNQNGTSTTKQRSPLPQFSKDEQNEAEYATKVLPAPPILPPIDQAVGGTNGHLNGSSGNEDIVSLRLVQQSELPSVAPPPALNKLQSQVHHISILVHIWLFISDIYTKEDLFEEAVNAVDEAESLVELLKKEQAAVESSARAWNFRGWGMGQSISRLMADVYAERGRITAPSAGPHRALEHYERALAYVADHPSAVLRLSRILLDIYEGTIPAEAPSTTDISTLALSSGSQLRIDSFLPPAAPPASTNAAATTAEGTTAATAERPASAAAATQSAGPDTMGFPVIAAMESSKRNNDPDPAALNRIACRERAYLLLMVQSKLGQSWDDSEVWFELSRAYELMGLASKAEECLWWVVSLEDSKPVRPWSSVGAVF